ncbi:MAG: MBL fold metallo-hydrolase [Candidatus Heimdallarchaeaceae archaeon]
MVEFIKVTPSVYAHTLGETRGNVAFIELEKSLVFVDSGMDPITAKEARSKAEQLTGLPVKYLIITHHHSDHILGNQVFEDCKIISSKDTLDLMNYAKEHQLTEENLEKWKEADPSFKERWKDLRIVFPDKAFEDKYVIEEGGKRVEIVQANGHTKGSSYLYIPAEQALITGDLLFSETYPYGGDPTADIYKWIKALQQMIDLDPKLVIPGHGPITSEIELKIQRDYMLKLVRVIEQKVKAGIKKEELVEQKDLPTFPYETDKHRYKLMLERTYDVVKEKLSK